MAASAGSSRYVLGPAFASGGMGTLHLGRVRGEAGFARVVAIKRLNPELAGNPKNVARFLDEARMAARVRHANVVATLDVREEDREIWIVMEYVEGVALSALLEEGAVPPDVALAIFEDVLSGLDAAHHAVDEHDVPIGLVHRDVSPQNVLVGVDGVARIGDFGIATARTRAVVTTSEGSFKGKLAYAAPEQLRGMPASVQSDLYATAVTMWEALTGRRLFTGESEAVVLYNVLETTPPRVSEAAPALGVAFDGAIARALDADPSKRHSSAREMAAALHACGTKAPARRVAEWVVATARERLSERARLVRAFEAEPVAIERAANAAPPRSSRGSRAAIGVAAAAIAIVSLVGVGVAKVVGARRAPASVATVAPPSTAIASAPVGAAPREPAPSASAPPPPPSAAPAQASPKAAAPHATTRPATVRPTGTARSRKDCDPPYRFDEHGDKHYLPECLRSP